MRTALARAAGDKDSGPRSGRSARPARPARITRAGSKSAPSARAEQGRHRDDVIFFPGEHAVEHQPGDRIPVGQTEDEVAQAFDRDPPGASKKSSTGIRRVSGRGSCRPPLECALAGTTTVPPPRSMSGISAHAPRSQVTLSGVRHATGRTRTAWGVRAFTAHRHAGVRETSYHPPMENSLEPRTARGPGQLHLRRRSSVRSQPCAATRVLPSRLAPDTETFANGSRRGSVANLPP